MDELKINSKLMQNVISKIASSAIKKKLGYKIDVNINHIEVKIQDDGNVNFNVGITGQTNISEFTKFTKLLELDL